MNKLKFILAAALPLSLALTISCSDGGGDDPGPGGSSSSGGGEGSSPSGTTETYTLVTKGDDYFSFWYSYEIESCNAGRFTTSKDSSEEHQPYSISNKIMTLGDEYDAYLGDTLLFKGTSNELIGTWTRTKSRCEDYYDDKMWCKNNYDITKAVFTNTTVAVTRDYCPTDYFVEEADFGDGWIRKVVDCNTMEISKGSEKVIVKLTKTGEEITYNRQTCKYEETKAKKQVACKSAWDRYGDEDYKWILNREYEECLEGILPEEFFDCYDCYDYCDIYPEECGYYDWCDYYPDDPDCDWGDWAVGKIAAKPVAKPAIKAKAKIKANAISKFPLLKNKK